MSYMPFAGRIRATPRSFQPERGAALLDALRGQARGGADLDSLLGGAPIVALLTAVAADSPYLAQGIEREAIWLCGAVAAGPEAAMARLLAEVGESWRECANQKAQMRVLRVAKRRAAILIGLADVGGVWDLTEVTGALADLADAATMAALRRLLADEAARGTLPNLDAKAPEKGSGYAILAMGKHGAHELNYSSDIDLVALFDETCWGAGDYAHVKDRFIRVTRGLVKMLSEATADGYVFRTDLRLRPDPSSTPVCIGMDSAERYYELYGRTWERAAFIKARAAAGDIMAGEKFLRAMTPFIWRRHLDYAAIADAHDINCRIREHRGHGAVTAAGHDIKLGVGGIREIEFFVQTQQLISGGRDPDLRDPTTRGALAALARAGWIDVGTCAALDEAYVRHRVCEHRLQMVDDQQTHVIPKSEAGRERIAAFLGFDSRAAFEADLLGRLSDVAARCGLLYEGERCEARDDDESIAARLDRLGFANISAAERIIENWIGGRIAATRSQRARTKLGRLAPMILEKLAEAANPDEALLEFDRFFSGLPAGVQILSLFEANPHLLDLLAEICGAAPRLAVYLGRNSGVFDAVLSLGFFASIPDGGALGAELDAMLDTAQDYEQRLDVARRWAKERRFQIGVQILRALVDPVEAGRAFSAVAETALNRLYPHVLAEFARRHGPPPGEGAVVVAMGKLGSHEMTASSDLDLIVIYDSGDATGSEGKKPLSVTSYYARLTQKIVAAMTVPTAEGALYEVDMRLRPSGRAGPLATGIDAFIRYQTQEAWTWEHMALTRARVVAGPAPLAARVAGAIAGVLARPRDRQTVLGDAVEMRARIDGAFPGALNDPWNIKYARGGLIDLEFIAQAGLLAAGVAGEGGLGTDAALARLHTAGSLDAAEAETLREAVALEQSIQQLERVALDKTLDPETAGPGLKLALARAAGEPGFEALVRALEAAEAAVVATWPRVFGRPRDAQG